MKLSAFFLDLAQLGDRKQAYGIEREMQGSGDRFPVFADALRQRCNGLLDTAIEQKLNQRQVFKRRDRLALVCADVSVDEVAHIRLVLFEVDLFIACQLDRVIAVEDLAVKNMVQNRKLAQSISDAGWGELVRQLIYKSEWYGRELVKIDRWFPSSKRCSCCGHIVEKMPLNVRDWVCPQCGTKHERDVNAANNILAAGLAVSVCGATVRPEESKSRKAGATKQKLRL